MRPPYAKPSRCMLHLAMQMQAPLDRRSPISAAISNKPDPKQQQLDLHLTERKDNPHPK